MQRFLYNRQIAAAKAFVGFQPGRFARLVFHADQ